MDADPLLLAVFACVGLAALLAASLILRPLRLSLEVGRPEGEATRFVASVRFLGIRLARASGSLEVPSLDALARPSAISRDARVHGRLRGRIARAAMPRARRFAVWLVGRTGVRGLAGAVLQRRRDIRMRRFEGRVVYALEDPAAEGRLYADVMAWLAWLDPGHHFELVPRWTFENTWHGGARLTLDVWAVRLALLLVGRVALLAWRAPAQSRAEAAAHA